MMLPSVASIMSDSAVMNVHGIVRYIRLYYTVGQKYKPNLLSLRQLLTNSPHFL